MYEHHIKHCCIEDSFVTNVQHRLLNTRLVIGIELTCLSSTQSAKSDKTKRRQIKGQRRIEGSDMMG